MKMPLTKRLLLILTFTLFSFYGFAQEDEENDDAKEIPDIENRTSEIKLNAFNFITFKAFDLTYEYIINSESSVGVSVLIDLNGDDDLDDGAFYYESFAITPYYRHYFSRKYAYGFYIEGFMMYNTQPLERADLFGFDDDFRPSKEKSNNLALGFAVGGKFLTRNAFVFDLYGGIGRNFITSEEDIATEIVPRLGISFGYRF